MQQKAKQEEEFDDFAEDEILEEMFFDESTSSKGGAIDVKDLIRKVQKAAKEEQFREEVIKEFAEHESRWGESDDFLDQMIDDDIKEFAILNEILNEPHSEPKNINNVFEEEVKNFLKQKIAISQAKGSDTIKFSAQDIAEHMVGAVVKNAKDSTSEWAAKRTSEFMEEHREVAKNFDAAKDLAHQANEQYVKPVTQVIGNVGNAAKNGFKWAYDSVFGEGSAESTAWYVKKKLEQVDREKTIEQKVYSHTIGSPEELLSSIGAGKIIGDMLKTGVLKEAFVQQLKSEGVSAAEIYTKLKVPSYLKDSSTVMVDKALQGKLDNLLKDDLLLWHKFEIGELNRKDFQLHHIVSDKIWKTNKYELWERAGMTPNDGLNKVLLPKSREYYPTRSIHNGRHTDEIHNSLIAEMNDILLQVNTLQLYHL